jgi:hypothetical protein
MRDGIRAAITSGIWTPIGIQVKQFMSATQLPRSKINRSGVNGDHKSIPGAYLLDESFEVRDFIRANGLGSYSNAELWGWIALTGGLDITTVHVGDRMVAVSVGYYHAPMYTYVTHLTVVHREVQSGVGLGEFMRREQIKHLRRRLQIEPMHVFNARGEHMDIGEHLQVVSLSANPQTGSGADAALSRGAREFQMHIFLKKLEWTQTGPDQATEVIMRIDEAMPILKLRHTLETMDVTPLLFVDS